MSNEKQLTGKTEEELWQQVTADLAGGNVYEYQASLISGDQKVQLVVDIDPGGGFEGGYAFTTFTSLISSKNDFRFALHHEGLADTAGKFFGMEDVVIGYPEFDEALIVKTNDREKVRRIFASEATRKTIQSLRHFTLHITHRHMPHLQEKQPLLELSIEEGITDVGVLKGLYDAFCEVLKEVEGK